MYDDVWWCMMMYDDVWWCMMICLVWSLSQIFLFDPLYPVLRLWVMAVDPVHSSPHHYQVSCWFLSVFFCLFNVIVQFFSHPLQSEVCLKIGYIPNYSHLIGIMISKTIGFRGTRHFQTHQFLEVYFHSWSKAVAKIMVSSSFAPPSTTLPATTSCKCVWHVLELPQQRLLPTAARRSHWAVTGNG